MTLLKTNTFEGGADSTDITVGNSGGASFDAFQAVTISDVTATARYRTAAAMHGSLGARFSTGAVAATAFAEWSLPTQTDVWVGFFLRADTLVTTRLVRLWGTGGANSGLIGSLQLTSGGILRWLSSDASNHGCTLVNPISTNTVYWVQVHIVPGTPGSANTLCEIELYDSAGTNGTNLLDSVSITVGETLAADVIGCRVGIVTTAVSNLNLDIDALRVSNVTQPKTPEVQSGTAGIGGTAGASSSASRDQFGTGTAPGSGAIAASGSVASSAGDSRAFETHVLYESAVLWGGTSGTAGTITGSATIGAAGGVSAAASVTAFGQATVTGAGAVTGAARGTVTGNATIGGVGGLAGSGKAETAGAAVVTGLGSVSAAATPDQIASATILVTGGLTATGSAIKFGVATIGGVGTVEGTAGVRDAFGALDMHGAGELTVNDAGVIAGPPEPPLESHADWELRPPSWAVLPATAARYPVPAIREIAYGELDAEGRVAYLRSLRYSRRVRARVQILDPAEAPVVNLSADDAVIYDGSIQVDRTSDVTRRLTLSIADPRRDLVTFDDAAAVPAPVGAGGFVAVERLDEVPELGQFVAVPIFRGPIASFKRAGPDVSLEALGKEAAMSAPNVLWQTIQIGRGTNMVEAIRRLAAAMGETRLRLPEVDRRLQRALSVPRGMPVWPVMQRLAITLGRDLYFDAAGYLTARVRPLTPAWRFTASGDESNVLSDPDVTYDVTAIRNAVLVVGRQPSKGPRPSGTAVAPPDHPLSPESLARGGRPRYIFERIEAENLARSIDCKAEADKALASFLIAGTAATFETVANPLIELGDVGVVEAQGLEATFRVTSFTLPLFGGSMSMGDVRRYAAPGARARVRAGR